MKKIMMTCAVLFAGVCVGCSSTSKVDSACGAAGCESACASKCASECSGEKACCGSCGGEAKSCCGSCGGDAHGHSHDE